MSKHVLSSCVLNTFQIFCGQSSLNLLQVIAGSELWDVDCLLPAILSGWMSVIIPYLTQMQLAIVWQLYQSCHI